MPTPPERAEAYPAPKVHHLLSVGDVPNPDGGFSATRWRRALARAYNQGPTGLDGILLDDVENEAGESWLVLNPTTLGTPLGRVPNEKPIEHRGAELYITRKQKEQMPRMHLLQRLGEIATTSTVPGLALAETVGTPYGVLAGVTAFALYFPLRSVSRIVQRRRAITALREFNEWAVQPNNGALLFSYKAFGAVVDDETGAAVREVAGYSRSYLGRPDNDKAWVYIEPARLIQSLLLRDHAPAELWTSGFGERAHSLAEAEQIMAQLRQEQAKAKERGTFTGHPDKAELAQIQDRINTCIASMVHIGIELAQQAKERAEAHAESQRIARAEALIDAVVNGAAKEPHPLEMHLQALHSTASTALAQLDLEQPDSHTIAEELGGYLRGCRGLFTNPSQIEQFYRGLFTKFGNRLPGLEPWEAVAEQLTTIVSVQLEHPASETA